MDEPSYRIRLATGADAGGIARVLASVVAERRLSAIDRAWPADEQRTYLLNLKMHGQCLYVSPHAGRIACPFGVVC